MQKNTVAYVVKYVIPVSENADPAGSDVLADRVYDSRKLIGYIMKTAANFPFRLEKAQNSNAGMTGCSLRKGIWW